MARSDSDDGIFSFLLGLFAGVAGGVLLGILFAPKSGDETREDVQRFVSGIPNKLNEEMSNPRGKTREFIDKARYSFESQVDKVRENKSASRIAKAKQAEQAASGYEEAY